MLEVLTLQYGALAQGVLIAIGLGFILLGALLFALFGPRPPLPLSRSWYYLRFGMASFLLALGQMLWLLYVPALKLGVSFLFVVTDAGAALAYGAYVAHFSCARSRDAYGHDGNAWMAFVPLINLVLIFKASQSPDPSRGSAGAAWGGVALALLSRGVTAVVENSADSITAQVQNDPAVIAIVQSLTLRAEGIEAALDRQVAAEGAPFQVEPGLLLSAVTRAGSQITYLFVLDQPGATSLDSTYRKQVHTNMCASLMPYLQAGASAAIRFARPDGAEIDVLALSVKECTA